MKQRVVRVRADFAFQPSDELPKSGLCGDGKRLVYAFPNKKKPPEGGV